LRTALAFLLIIAGLVLLATPYLPLGLCLILGGWRVHQSAGVRDEASFTSVLMGLGGLGAVAVMATGLWDWIKTLL
jgi:Ca2+/H+ antiporter